MTVLLVDTGQCLYRATGHWSVLEKSHSSGAHSVTKWIVLPSSTDCSRKNLVC